jgi:hypothetical protein
LDVGTLIDLINTSAGANAALNAFQRTITPEGAVHVDDMMQKDVRTFGRVMRERGLDPRALEDWGSGGAGPFGQGVEIVSGISEEAAT